MVKNVISKAAALVALAIAVAGCGASAAEPEPVPQPSSTSVVDATTTPAVTVAETSVPAAGEPWMVIQIFTGKRYEIRVIDQDGVEFSAPGSDVPGSHQTNPDWSPDGNFVTFGMTAGDGRDDLWVVGADGSDAHMAFDCAGDCEYIDDPAWSPDGSSIAVCLMSSVDGADVGTLAVVDVASGSITEIAAFEPTDFCAGPRWSPDGKSIVLEVVHSSGTSVDDDVTGVTLSIVDVATGQVVTSLTDPALFAATADWSPATGEIVYSALASPTADNPDLFAIRPDGAAPRQLTDLGSDGGAFEPSVSPDGSTVVFVGGEGLLTLDLATGEITPAPTPPVAVSHPRFVPAP